MSDPQRTRLIDQDSTQVDDSKKVVRNDKNPTSSHARSAHASPRSCLINEAVDEYRRLTAVDASITIDSFCRRYTRYGSSLQSSIYRQIELDVFADSVEWGNSLAQERPWPEPGEDLGSFVVEREIGRGAFARVYLCRQPSVGNRHVVVKAGRLLQDEAHTLGQLRHANIVPIFAVETDNRRECKLLCMPYLGASTLHDLIDAAFERGLPTTGEVVLRASRVREGATMLVETAPSNIPLLPLDSYFDCIAYLGLRLTDALSHAHKRAIVHGDIKPSNVILSPHGEPFLVDFNLSGNAQLARAPRGGTLPYMPPEQLAAVCGDVATISTYDGRSDLFSLGVVLYELLTGRLPFPTGGSGGDANKLASELADRQQSGPVRLRQVDPRIPAKLAELVEKSLEWEPRNRLATCEELNEALRTYLQPVHRVRRKVRTHRRPLGIALLVAVLAAVLTASHWLSRPPHDVIEYRHGIASLKSGDALTAEAAFAAALAANPSNFDARFELAKVLLARERYKEAQDHFFTLHKATASPTSAGYLGFCFSLQGDATRAIPWYEAALAKRPETAALHNNLAVSYEIGGRALALSGRMATVGTHIREALKLAPESLTVQWNSLLFHLTQAEQGVAPIGEIAVDRALGLARRCRKDRDVQWRAAMAVALFENATTSQRAAGVEFLRRAIDLGSPVSRTMLEEDKTWDAFRAFPEFSDILLNALDEPPLATPSPGIPRYLQPS